MNIGKKLLSAAALLLAVMAWPAAVPAQDLMTTALSSFPTGTIRVEFSSPAKLRALPDYATLSKRYVGPNLLALENDLAKLGIQQDDVDDLVIGWQAHGSNMVLSGVAQGRFDPKAVADRAVAQGLAATPVGSASAYCLGAHAGGNCVVMISETLGAFGFIDSLRAVMKARAGEAPNAASDASFAKHVQDAKTDAAIWGVAVGPAITDWFRGWMPNQSNVQLDWAATFKSVQVLRYSVQTADKVILDVKMDCANSQGAQSLTQVMQGLKLLQQMAWQNQNPTAPNPFQALVVEREGTQVRMGLTTQYSALEAGIPGQ
jgi:hypothetical protein